VVTPNIRHIVHQLLGRLPPANLIKALLIVKLNNYKIMKLMIAIFIIANLALISCAKTRTCSCKSEGSTTTVFAPRTIAQPTTMVRTRAGAEEHTIDRIKKEEMKRLKNCNNRIETSTDSYTVEGSVTTITTSGGSTFYITNSYTADVISTNVDEYTCEIK